MREETANTADLIIDWVRSEIFECRLAPGAALRQDDIAAQFHTSKPPVREALRRLEALDYVELKPNRGFFVRRFTRQEIIDLFEICALFEGYAVQTSGNLLTAADLQRLERCVRKITDAGDLLEMHKADGAFHLGLVGRIRNPTIKSKLADFHAYFRMYYRAMGGGDMQQAVETYRIILSDLRQGNVVAASSRVQVHLLEQGRRLSELGDALPKARGARAGAR